MKTSRKLISGLIMGVLVYQLVYAQGSNTQALQQQGFEIAHQLNEFAEQNEANLCSGDILVAAAYIKLAAHELTMKKHPSALTSLAYGQYELKEISNSRAYCTNFATQMKPYFDKVSLIKKELEREPVPETDELPDSCIK